MDDRASRAHNLQPPATAAAASISPDQNNPFDETVPPAGLQLRLSSTQTYLLARRSAAKRFALLADFLERVPNDCPHELFRESSRASQIPIFVNRNHLIVVEKENFATRTAALIVPTVGDNRLRHEALQRFMLTNDSVTVAPEIPIWLTAGDIDALEVEYGLELSPEGASRRVLTGHIDFLQVRNGAVHILDYKPDARTNKPIAQLTLYALALTRLAGLRLFDIKCAWFNEEQYCEFFPRSLLAHTRPRGGGEAGH